MKTAEDAAAYVKCWTDSRGMTRSLDKKSGKKAKTVFDKLREADHPQPGDALPLPAEKVGDPGGISLACVSEVEG